MIIVISWSIARSEEQFQLRILVLSIWVGINMQINWNLDLFPQSDRDDQIFDLRLDLMDKDISDFQIILSQTICLLVERCASNMMMSIIEQVEQTDIHMV